MRYALPAVAGGCGIAALFGFIYALSFGVYWLAALSATTVAFVTGAFLYKLRDKIGW